ncbi:hypothetical protein [Shinella sp.]|uniref:hypothetical protein n=1 Tax=Shinella sp. TaxID=1870904 RepID=UPI0029AB6B0F|nr:hypothetical protein [Shinella sp.]MDX3974752.1 hypothetical protein [Shinella sp.]
MPNCSARPARVFIEVVLPACTTGIFSSALFAFVISLNEFVMALFLTDRINDAHRLSFDWPAGNRDYANASPPVDRLTSHANCKRHSIPNI